MAFLDETYPNYLAHLTNNGSFASMNQVCEVDQRNGEHSGSFALDVVTLQKSNSNVQSLEQEDNKEQITFRTNKNIGEEIKLEIEIPYDSNIEDIKVEGVTLVKQEHDQNSLNYTMTYQLTSQEVRIIGTVTALNCEENKITSLDISQSPTISTLKCANNLIEELNTINNRRLYRLFCNYNQIKTLDLSNAEHLAILDCSDNQITTLKVSYKNINEINCNFNQIEELNVSNAQRLFRLSCNYNKLTKLTVENNPLLSHLFIDTNYISEISLANNPSLSYVSAVDLKISLAQMEQLVNSLPTIGNAQDKRGSFSIMPVLGSVKNMSNALKQILNNKGWKLINLVGSEVTEVPEIPYITFTTNKNIGEEINLQIDTERDTIDTEVEGATLVKSELKRDPETKEQFEYKTYRLTSQTVKFSGNVSTLICPNNNMTSLDASHSMLIDLDCSSNALTTLNVTNAKHLVKLICTQNKLTTLDVTTNKTLRVLICSENNISTLNIAQGNELHYLFCSYNKLNELNVSNMEYLRELSCVGNEMTKLNVTNNPNLKSIDCHRNNITQIKIANNPNLTNLEIYANKITLDQMEQLANDLPEVSDPSNDERILVLNEIVGDENKYSNEIINKILDKGWKIKNYSKNIFVIVPEDAHVAFTTQKNIGETINVKFNVWRGYKISDIKVEGATLVSSVQVTEPETKSVYESQTYRLTSQTVKIKGGLSVLYCEKNNITSLDISHSKIHYLNCSDNDITELNTNGDEELTHLYCQFNKLQSLNVSTNYSLRVLHCPYNNISTLNFPAEGDINLLYCFNNKLKELNVSDMETLQEIHCFNNEMTSFTANNNKELKFISCYNNKISQINVANTPKLIKLYCFSNNIDLYQMEQLVNNLPVLSNPTDDEGMFIVVSRKKEGNKISNQQMLTAKNKGWKVSRVIDPPSGISTTEFDENQPRKVFDLNGREVNENQVKGIVIIKQGNKTYKKVVK